MSAPRILLYDIETFPIEGYVWGLRKQNVPLNMIKRDWSMMSFAAKWLGEPGIVYRDNRKARDPRDDSKLLPPLHKLLSAADIIVAHNGDKFDIRKIRSRFLATGLPPLPPITSVDTLLASRKLFAHTSHRLEFLSQALLAEKKSTHGQYPGFELWRACMMKDPAAWQECQDYNEQDVVTLEELYLLMRPWIDGHPNVANFTEPDSPACPKCGSANVVQKGYRHTQVGRYARYRCTDCGGWSRGRQMQNSKDQRSNLLVS